uniref:Uncharacterized protein n=2 Tax=Cryptomonas curvata TaxID=233186 RepID=A0A6T7Y1Y4_9CRYP|mmetsp:Transcript_28847/g.60526  ORF Transcript_28847/g.60526 Transcript_28847/m.60526 type:complete len:159 (+) Transcript_28847:784-1260(+)
MELSFKNRYNIGSSGLVTQCVSEWETYALFIPIFIHNLLCRGYFSGENNSVDGKIKRGSDTLYKIHGRWDRVVTCTEKKTKQEEVLFDIEEKRRYFTPPTVVPEAKQKHYESRRVWSQVSQALKAQNIDLATEEKLRLEDGQRAGKKERDDSGRSFHP